MQAEIARQQMIYHQIRPWDVTDKRILNILGAVPREHFVPSEYSGLAFADTAIPLPCGQHMLKPVVEGRILQHLNVRSDDKVLVVGAGSGYLTGCIATLARQVTSIDIHPELVEFAARNLVDQQIRNVELLAEDFNQYEPATEFDRTVITGSMPIFDARTPEWLRENGRMLLITGTAPTMEVEIVVRNEDHYTRRALFETVVDQLENVPQTEKFAF